MFSASPSLLQPLSSPLLTQAGFRHGFYTRQGGASAGNFASLNTSKQVGDAGPLVEENLGRIAVNLQIWPSQLCVPTQVHGCEIAFLADTDRAVDVALRKTDAVLSQSSGPACAVRTADCIPILLADPGRGTVAAVHAGWRGIVQKIVPAAVQALIARGAERSHLLVAIGPHISVKAFEVGTEVAQELQRASSDPDVAEHSQPGQPPHVSLLRILRAQLTDCGLTPAQVDVVPGCTFGEPERFFSYRRDGAKSGRQLSVIVPRNDKL